MNSLPQQIRNFLTEQRSLVLATMNEDGSIDTGYAPYIYDDNRLVVLVSELAIHTQNLYRTQTQNTGAAKISLLVVSDQCDQPFACQRLSAEATFQEIPRNADEYPIFLAHFESDFGEIIPLLNSLPDFHCFAFQLLNGRFIKGFGQSFMFDENLEQKEPLRG